MSGERLLYRQEYDTEYGKKEIAYYHGDLCQAEEGFDVVFCSAGRKAYYPSRGTLIYHLMNTHGIFVGALAENPEIAISEKGCWLSRETGSSFAKRIACVEPVYYEDYHTFKAEKPNVIAGSMISAMVDILAAADRAGIKTESIAMPILGSGRQHMGLEYTVPQLTSNCVKALETVKGLKKISVYELNAEKAEFLVRAAARISDNIETGKAQDLFISYSTKNSEKAEWLRSCLTEKGLSCWMAPDSIPAGEDYTSAIPVAIGSIPTFLVVLTKEAEESKWVKRELVSAVNAGLRIIPFCIAPYDIREDFKFILAIDHIYESWRFSEEEQIAHVVANTIRAKKGR